MNADVLDRLRAVRADPSVLFSSEVHDAVLGRVADPVASGEMGMPVAPVVGGQRARRRRVAMIGGAVLTAAAVVTVSLVTAELRGPARLTSQPAQQAVVQQLADAARRSGSTALRPGQYWYVVSLAHRTGDIGALSTSRTSTVPIRGNQSTKQETWTAPNGSGWARGASTGQRPTVTRLPAATDASGIPSPGYLAGLSSDPATLLRYVRAHAVQNPLSPTRDDGTYREIAQLLTTGYTPGDLRAALILDLAQLRDVTVSTNATDALGRPAVAFEQRVETAEGTLTQSLLFAPATGQFLQTDTSAVAVTATTTIASSSIVDHVPADVTR